MSDVQPLVGGGPAIESGAVDQAPGLLRRREQGAALPG